jgi:hypothetical protein
MLSPVHIPSRKVSQNVYSEAYLVAVFHTNRPATIKLFFNERTYLQNYNFEDNKESWRGF